MPQIWEVVSCLVTIFLALQPNWPTLTKDLMIFSTAAMSHTECVHSNPFFIYVAMPFS